MMSWLFYCVLYRLINIKLGHLLLGRDFVDELMANMVQHCQTLLTVKVGRQLSSCSNLPIANIGRHFLNMTIKHDSGWTTVTYSILVSQKEVISFGKFPAPMTIQHLWLRIGDPNVVVKQWSFWLSILYPLSGQPYDRMVERLPAIRGCNWRCATWAAWAYLDDSTCETDRWL